MNDFPSISAAWPSVPHGVATAPPVDRPPLAVMLKELSAQVEHLCALLNIQDKAHENGASPMPPGVSYILQDYSRACEKMTGRLTSVIREVESIRRELGQ